jgi:hypothetical protein
MDSNYLKKVRRFRALHHFERFRASRESLLPALELQHPEHAEAGQTDNDQVDGDDEIQEPRHNQNQDSRNQGDDRGNVRSGDGH